MLAASTTRRRELPAPSAPILVMRFPVCLVLILAFKEQCPRTLRSRALLVSLRGACEVGFLGRRLRLVDRALPLWRREGHPYRNVRDPWFDHRRPRPQAAVELVEILDAREWPGVACGNFVEQEIARAVGGVHGRAVQCADMMEGHAAGFAHAGD